MSFQPLGGISWGASAPRPRSSLVTALGSVSWPTDGPPPAAAPSPCGASDPPSWAPAAVFRPAAIAAASTPSRTARRTVRPVNPGPCLVVEALLAIGPPAPNRPSHGCHPYDEQKHRAVRATARLCTPRPSHGPHGQVDRGTAGLSNVARYGRDSRRAWPGRAVSQDRPTVSTLIHEM